MHRKENCASRWSFTKNHYMMHGQQNITFWAFIVYTDLLTLNRKVFFVLRKLGIYYLCEQNTELFNVEAGGTRSDLCLGGLNFSVFILRIH